MRSRTRQVSLTVFLLFLCLVTSWALVLGLRKEAKPIQASISLQQALSDQSGSFKNVTPGRSFSFPADHGKHPEYKTEWWYFTGNLTDSEKNRYGYQITLFRVGSKAQDKNQSAWASDALFMGHFAISDVKNDRFYTFERLSREALELSGVSDGPKIWLEDWVIEREEQGWQLKAQAQDEQGSDVSLSLELRDVKPPLLQGEGGYSRKGPKAEHASYYVSQTRLESAGSLHIAGREYEVSGLSWFDHEWSSQALAEGLVGWDWFSLQLDDQTELMLYLLRYQDGRLEPASSGVLVGADGKGTKLSFQDFLVEATAKHRSRRGIPYPSAWNIDIPAQAIKLQVTPVMADQEMAGTVPYWEGAVDVKGSKDGREILGRGFVELTGY